MNTEPNARSEFRRTTFELTCWRGHRWTVSGYEEWGGGFLNNENEAQCPTCGAWEGEAEPMEETS